MILSKANETVVWELNELLAADRRAKAFSEASVAGEYAERSEGFEEAHWQTIGGGSDAEEVLMAAEEPTIGAIEGETEALEDDPEVEEVIDVDQLLESRYQEGIAEGIRQSNLENQQREALAERFCEAVRSEVAALPRVWPVVTDLSLDIAKTVCLQSLRLNENAFGRYLNKALQGAELPENMPVEIKVSPAMAELVSPDELEALLADQPITLVVSPELSDGDITIQYEQVAIDRLLEREFAQLREQLVAQFPDQLSEP